MFCTKYQQIDRRYFEILVTCTNFIIAIALNLLKITKKN